MALSNFEIRVNQMEEAEKTIQKKTPTNHRVPCVCVCESECDNGGIFAPLDKICLSGLNG